MSDNFNVDFGEAINKILEARSNNSGEHIMQVFADIIKSGLEKNKQIYLFFSQEWNGHFGVVDFRLNYETGENSHISVFTITVRRGGGQMFWVEGKSLLDPNRCFKVLKTKEEIDPKLAKTLILSLV